MLFALKLKSHLVCLGIILALLGVLSLLVVIQPVSADGGPEPAFVVIDGDYEDLRAVRAVIEANGGAVPHIFPPNAMIAHLTAAQALEIGRRPDVALVTFEATAKNSMAAARAPLAAAAWNSVFHGELLNPRPESEPMWDDVIVASAVPETVTVKAPGAIAAPEPGYYDTSRYLYGDVIIAMVLPESNGVISPSVENWTTAEVYTVTSSSVSGMNVWWQSEPNAAVTFIYVFGDKPPVGGVSNTVSCNYEAGRMSNFDNNVMTSFMATLGYSSTSWNTSVYSYVNDLRKQYGADWAYLVQVRDDSDGSCGRASAYLGGPATTLFNCDLRSGGVLRHESGHIFQASDEYCPDACQSPVGRSGYLQVVNANSQGPSGTGGPGFFNGKGEGISNVMINNGASIGPYTRGQIGWRDSDGDGILDILDTYPRTVGLIPTVGAGIVVNGLASVVPLPGSGNDISIDRVAGVDVRINGLTWLPAQPVDGAFSAVTETFQLTLPLLPNGTYSVTARTRNGVGNVEPIFTSTTFTVASSPVTNAVPFVTLAVLPMQAAVNTTFTLDAGASADLEGQALEARWDWENDGTWDTGFSPVLSATHVYTLAGSYVAAVEVRDAPGASAVVTRAVAVLASNAAPVAAFTVMDGDARFGVITATFSFDPAGSSDAETALNNLAFRWDWTGDGTWDTSWVTGPVTISRDYVLTAQGMSDGLPRSNHWTVKLMVRDAGGATATTSRHIWANPYDHAPVATKIFSATTWNTVATLPIDPNLVSDADFTQTWDGLKEYRFDWNSDGNWDTEWQSAAAAAILKFPGPGLYPVTAQVRDLYGAWATVRQTMTVLTPSALSLSNDSLNVTIVAGTRARRMITLTNQGEFSPTFNFQEVALGGTSPYTVRDSRTGGLIYNWRNTYPGAVYPGAGAWHATAAPRDADDEGYVGPINLPTPFPFYGQVYTQVYVAANGYLSFAPPPADLGQGQIPSTTVPNGLISPFWGDLDLSVIATQVPTNGVGNLVYNNVGTTDGAFVVEYQGVETRGHTNWSTNYFEVVLRPNGEILFQYNYSMADASNQLVGIESPDGTTGVTYTLPVTRYMAVAFTPENTDIPWLQLSSPSGMVPRGVPQAVELTFDATELAAGVYQGRVLLYTNDMTVTYRNFPLTLTVIEPVYQLNLTPAATVLTATPGTTVTAVFALTNTGNISDSFGLSVAGNGWSVQVMPTTTMLLAAGAGTPVTVTVVVPEGSNGQAPAFPVVGQSLTNPAISQTVMLRVLSSHQLWLPIIIRQR